MDTTSTGSTSEEEGTATMTAMLSNNNTSRQQQQQQQKKKSRTIIIIYSILFVFLFYKISTTLYKFPLFPIQYNSIEWNSVWLVTTVIDYYGACFCFGGVVLSSESSWMKGIAWNLGFALLGSPICCLWVILWIYNGGTLQLLDKSNDTRRR
jgi:cation transport ATPase